MARPSRPTHGAASGTWDAYLESVFDDLYGDTSWTAPTLVNSWANFGGGFSAAAYRKVAGLVIIKGLVTNGTSPALPSTIFTLPAGYRPAENKVFAASAGNGTTNVLTEVRVLSTGVVTLQSGGVFYLSIDGITFFAEA